MSILKIYKYVACALYHANLYFLFQYIHFNILHPSSILYCMYNLIQGKNIYFVRNINFHPNPDLFGVNRINGTAIIVLIGGCEF